jgi:HK97 family phage prohead protease
MDKLLIKNLTAKLEVKELNDEYVYLEGLASTFGGIDRVGDTILRGAFYNSLAKRMPKLLNQHDMCQVIGVIDEAIEMQDGLFIKARMPRENSTVMDLLPLLKMGALGDFSIGFNVIDSEMTPEGTRILKEIDLWEVSIVTIPANPDAKIMRVKKLDADEVNIIDAEKAESILTKREFEQVLKDTGLFTKKAVVILASKFNEIAAQGEPGAEKKGQRDSVDDGKSLLEAVEQLKKSLTK